jgi:exopolyphosphatase/guanosine-5'-triphosphate,3'-diphosphate pyrophosphatase
MRTAVVDVGSNSAHVDVVDLVPGNALDVVETVKVPTRLAEAIGADDRIEADAVERVVSAVGRAVRAARTAGAGEIVAFATSAIRDAANGHTIVERVERDTGVVLSFLSGVDEARLTFMAVRAWYGWQAGSMVVCDIGGGSLEIAAGDGADPRSAVSVPLGAGRLTRELLPGDPPGRRQFKRLRAHVAEVVGPVAAEITRGLPPAVLPVATSKTFTQLAKLTGGRARDGSRFLDRKALHDEIPVLAAKKAAKRAKLKGVSASRARQILAGAVVADEVMRALGLDRVRICPWALREGVALNRLATLTAHAGDELGGLLQPVPCGPPRLHAVAAGT